MDEFIDAQMRMMKRSKTIRGWKWQGMAATVLLLGIGALVLVPERFGVRLVFSASSMCLGAVIYAWLYPSLQHRHVRKLIFEKLGSGPFPCSFLLSETGIDIELNGTRIGYSWKNVDEVLELNDSLEIWMKDGGLVVLLKRFFDSTEDFRKVEESVRAFARMAEIS